MPDATATPAAPAPAPAAVPAVPATPAPAAQAATPPVTPAAAPAAPAAPAEFAITLPAGAKVNDATLKAFTAKAKDWGLSSKQASDLVAFQLETAAVQEKAYSELVAKQRQADFDKLKADPVFGGAKFDQTQAQAQSALKQFFGEPVSKALAELGLDSHPDLVKGLARIRQAIAEDSIGSTTAAKGATVDTEEARMRRMMPTSYDQIQSSRAKQA